MPDAPRPYPTLQPSRNPRPVRPRDLRQLRPVGIGSAEGLDPSAIRALGVCSQFVDSYVSGEPVRGLTLYGDVGRGKTHLLVALVR